MARSKSVFVTGGSGFIAKHIIRVLLDEGYSVHASVRASARAEETRAAVAPNIKETIDLDKKLRFSILDLTKDAGWAEALKGSGALIHTASPFPMSQPADENELVLPAVEGTRRALTAARDVGIDRVVMTSSVVAVAYKRLAAGRTRYTESDWSDLNAPEINPYAKSKTLAEKAAWSFVRENQDMRLTTINPGMVLGPALDTKIGTSLQVIQRLMRGKDPLVPRMGFPVVDVRDVATMHVRALQTPESVGARFIATERFMWMQDIATLLKTEYPNRRIPTRLAPDLLLKAFALLDPALKSIIPLLGIQQQFDNAAASEVLGMEFIEARQAIKTSAAGLIRDHLID